MQLQLYVCQLLFCSGYDTLTASVLAEYFSTSDLDLLDVDNHLVSRGVDLGINLDQAIVAPVATEFEVGEGEIVVGGFDAAPNVNVYATT